MRRYGFDLTVTVVCFCLLGFFAWHGLNGKRSFTNQKTILVKVSELEDKRDNVRAKREVLQTRVALLRPESIDLDMLEEMSRQMLGFTKSNEIIMSE